jgi:YD repeat-containing protein
VIRRLSTRGLLLCHTLERAAVTICAVAAIVLSSGVAHLAGQSGEIQYVYDDLGRLLAVIDASGQAAIYTYDAVGNVLSITRQSASTVTILTFLPKTGPSGTSVTIYGLGFSATAGDNAVAFNGTPATLSAASPTKLVVVVPAAASTGPIAVTTPNGTAVSSAAFVVASGTAPSITGFSPQAGTPGTAVSISGSGFQPTAALNRLAFNIRNAQVQSATSTTLSTVVPADATSGPLSVSTPFGLARSTTDFFVPPGTFAVSEIGLTGRLTPGQPLALALPSANKVGLVLFDGLAGQRVAIRCTSVSIASSLVTIYGPDGATLVSSSVSTSGGFLETPFLLVEGTYTVVIDPTGTSTGNMTLTSYVSTDVTGAITPGGSPVTVTATTPGQNVLLTFNGVSGQRISLRFSSLSIATSNVSIKNPDGTLLVAPTQIDTLHLYLDRQTLPATGTYTLLIDPVSFNTGSATATLYDVPADATGTIVPGGAAVPLSLETPGQNAQLAFAGTAGQRVSLRFTSLTISTSFVSITNPDGSTLVSSTQIDSLHTFLDTTTLPATGTYTIAFGPYAASTGNATLTLYDVPADLAGTITPGGAALTLSVTVPGQNATASFTGAANQRVSLLLTSMTASPSYVSLKKPDGTFLVNPTYTSASSSFIDTQTLPTAGTYTILFDPYVSVTGSVTLTLYDVPADPTGTLTVGGSAVTLTTTTPGQNASASFSGTAGQQVTVRLTSNTIGWLTLSLVNPSGTTVVSTQNYTSSFNLATQTLATTGTYVVKVNPSGSGTGSAAVSVTTP